MFRKYFAKNRPSCFAKYFLCQKLFARDSKQRKNMQKFANFFDIFDLFSGQFLKTLEFENSLKRHSLLIESGNREIQYWCFAKTLVPPSPLFLYGEYNGNFILFMTIFFWLKTGSPWLKLKPRWLIKTKIIFKFFLIFFFNFSIFSVLRVCLRCTINHGIL